MPKECLSLLNVQATFNLLHWQQLGCVVLLDPELLPCLQDKPALGPDPLQWKGNHVTVVMPWQPKVHPHWLDCVTVAGLCSCANMFTESLLEGPLSTTNILRALDLCTLA